jgi:hypothetical protein
MARAAGHSARGIAAPPVGEPAHVAVRAVGEKLREPALRKRGRVRRRDADRIESVFARGAPERGLDLMWIGQKSRSA